MKPITAILDPLTHGFLPDILPSAAPTTNRIDIASATAAMPAVCMSLDPMSRKGDTTMAQTISGAEKLAMAIRDALAPERLCTSVPWRSRSIADSIFLTRVSCSCDSASYTLTPVDIARATLLVSMVPMTISRSECAAKADPMTTPSITNVESKMVLTM